MEFNYAYSDGTKNLVNWIYGNTANPDEVKLLLDKLTEPKRGVSIGVKLSESNWADIDFYVSEHLIVGMEIMPYSDDMNFAEIDISTAKQIVDVIFKLSEIKLFRQMLQELPIKWIA
jgi:hypothetical protein